MAKWLLASLLFVLYFSEGQQLTNETATAVFPPLTQPVVRSLLVVASSLSSTMSATATDSRTSIYFSFSTTAFGSYRRLLTSAYREMSFSVATLPAGVGVYGKWGIGTSNTDAFGVYRDDMLGTQYVVSTWTDCCSAEAFILVSALDESSTTVTVSLPSASSLNVTAGGQTYTSDFTIQLGLREVVTLTSTFDLSGTMVTGSRTILVQSGSNKAAVQGTTKSQLIEMLPPLDKLGTTHLGVPTTGRTSDVYRLVSTPGSNSVTIQEDNQSAVTITLTSASPVYDYIAVQPVIITSSQPLLVTQFSSSDDSGTIPPSMVFIPCTDYWANYYVIKEADTSFTRPEYVYIIVKTSVSSGVRMTYSNFSESYVTSWSTFQSDATYSYVTLRITETFALDHSSSESFMAIQYGVNYFWAYSFLPAFSQTTTSITTTAATTTTTASGEVQVTSSTSTNSNSSTPDSSQSSSGDSTVQTVVVVASSAVGLGVVGVVVWRVAAYLSQKALTSKGIINVSAATSSKSVVTKKRTETLPKVETH